MRWYFLRIVVDKHYSGGSLCLMWWVIMLDGVVFLRIVVEKHYSGGLLCLSWWYFLRIVVDKHYSGGLLCLMWWVIMFDAPPQYEINTTTVVRIPHSSGYKFASVKFGKSGLSGN